MIEPRQGTIAQTGTAGSHPNAEAIRRLRAARDLLLTHREEYDTAYREFRWPRLTTFNWALDWFDGVLAIERPDQTALWIVEEDGAEAKLTFGQLAERSSRVAAWLRARGVLRGDRIMLMLGNQVELWEATLAAMKLGAVIVPSSTLLGPEDIRCRIDRGEIRHVIARSVDTPRFVGVGGGWTPIAVGDAVPGWLCYDDADGCTDVLRGAASTAADPLLLYFTSGTTAEPKLVEHSHVSYPVGHLSTMYWLGLLPGDIHLNISSPGWGKHAWSNVFAPWLAGATVLVVNTARFSAPRLLDEVVRCGVTTFCAPPTVWRMLIQAELSAWRVGLRECLSAGEPLNPEVIEQVRAAWGVTVRDGYGQTETTAQVGNAPGQVVLPGSMGRELPGYVVTIVDPVTGKRSMDGVGPVEGEICLDLAVSPVGLMTGYRDDPVRTAEVTRDGLYRTGDIAVRDIDGYLHYIGRADDIFKASDYRISPFELESALLEHEAVLEAAVVPSPDPMRLAVPKAYVVLADGWPADEATAASILRFARVRLAPFQRVRRVEFGELPKTISGKSRRVALREQEMARLGDGHIPSQRAPMEYWEEDFPWLKQE